MSLALFTAINGFEGSGRDRRRDEMLPCFCRTTRVRHGGAPCTEIVFGAERRARIKRYRRDVAANRPIRFIEAAKPLSLMGYKAIHGQTA